MGAGLGEMSVGATPPHVTTLPLPSAWPGLRQIFITKLLEGPGFPPPPFWALERNNLEGVERLRTALWRET